ncbi:hypothetical protein BV25DRAFT_1961823, partial [Artomyces pyxidatus]
MWQRGKVWTEIRPCLRLFKADTFPQAINWTLYPITSMVDAMYKSVRTSKGPVDPYTVELLSQLDRVINFAHTGSPAVFVHGLMKKTWLSLGILEHGYPSLWAGAIRQNGRFERVNPVYWPTDDKGNPLMASLRAQQHTFGKEHVTSYKVQFYIKHAAEGHPGEFWNDSLRKRSIIQRIAQVTIKTILEETVDFVYEEVRKEIDLQLAATARNTPERRRVRERLRNLDSWFLSAFPFGYSPDTLLPLVRALHPGGEGPMPVSLDYAQQAMSYLELCEMMYAYGNKNPPAPKAPIRSRGVTVPILKAAIPAMRHVLKESQVVAKELIMSVLRETLMSLEVARLPTSPRRGTTTVTAKLWVSLGKSDCQPRRVMTKYLTQEEKQQVEVEQHITKLKDNDANAP